MLNSESVKSAQNYAYVCYSREDSNAVYPIIRLFTESGFDLWYDGGLQLSEKQPELVMDKIKGCKAFVLFVSKNSVKSNTISNEISSAYTLCKPIIHINLDTTPIPSEWSYGVPQRGYATSQLHRGSEEFNAVSYQLRNCRSSSIASFWENNKDIIIKVAAVAAALVLSILLISFAFNACTGCGSAVSGGGTSGYNDTNNQNDYSNESNNESSSSEYNYSGIEVNDIITFGHFEQDNYSGNGAEEIEWRVLDVQENKALIISEYGLYYRPYNEQHTATSWENCTLRDWMNSTFYNKAFSESEKNMILLSDISNDNNSKYQTSAGRDTKDRIFCLSLYEAKHYFANDVDRMCRATDYAYATCEGSANGGIECWWLRTPGESTSTAAYVQRRNGACNHSGLTVMDHGVIARPAMWIELD